MTLFQQKGILSRYENDPSSSTVSQSAKWGMTHRPGIATLKISSTSTLPPLCFSVEGAAGVLPTDQNTVLVGGGGFH